jgi:two-component system sensor histidine kinase MtrB
VWGEPGEGAHFRVTLPRRLGDSLAGSPLPLVPADAARGEGAVAVAATSDGTAVVAAVAEVPDGDIDSIVATAEAAAVEA